MGVPKLSIVFDNTLRSYYPGSIVSGIVCLTLDKPQKFRGLKIKFLGRAHVSWNESESYEDVNGKQSERTVEYWSNEDYFTYKTYLDGSPDDEIEFPEGCHEYPFSATLPLNLPTSFEGTYGYVRYTIVASLDRPWRIDYKTIAEFRVSKILDLNEDNQAKEPVQKEEMKTFCCFCCKSGPLTLVASVPQTGYIPGQDIPVTIEVNNASNITVQSIVFQIQQEEKWTSFFPRTKSINSWKDLNKISLNGLRLGRCESFNQSISVPLMPFVYLNGCSTIEVAHYLKVSASVNWFHWDLSIYIPLVLGSVPIYNDFVPFPRIGLTVPPEVPHFGNNEESIQPDKIPESYDYGGPSFAQFEGDNDATNFKVDDSSKLSHSFTKNENNKNEVPKTKKRGCILM